MATIQDITDRIKTAVGDDSGLGKTLKFDLKDAGVIHIDGGSVTIPDFGIYSTDGKWMIENHGVDPDFEVENTPESMINGQDLQLEKAIQWQLEQLQKNPPKRPARPEYKKQ